MRFTAGVASVVLAAAVACDGAQGGQPRREFVGVVTESDGDTSFALLLVGTHVAGYVCSDEPDEGYPWFSADLADETDAQVRMEKEGWTLTAAWTDWGAAGILTAPDGQTTAWSAPRAREGTLSGLYGAYDEGCLTGVIVVDDGSGAAPIVRGVWCSAGGELAQVTPVTPMALRDGQLAVEVALPSGPRRLDVTPVELPLK